MTSLLVVDASALVEYLFRTEWGLALGHRLEDSEALLVVPAICDVAVVAACRRALLNRQLTVGRAEEALADYGDLPLARYGHVPLMPRMLELRSNFSAYDAAYVALAETLGAPLLTADAALARVVRTHTEVMPLSS